MDKWNKQMQKHTDKMTNILSPYALAWTLISIVIDREAWR